MERGVETVGDNVIYFDCCDYHDFDWKEKLSSLKVIKEKEARKKYNKALERMQEWIIDVLEQAIKEAEHE